MSLTLPDRPNFDHLKKQAKELLQAFQRGDAAAAARFSALASTAPREGRTLKLADAQHVIANEYGFATWAALKARVEALARPFDPVDALKTALRAQDVPAVRRLFTAHPVLRAKINEPLPDYNFESTALLGALGSREMIDAVLDAGADINVKSGWWAGGFGVLDNTSPDLAAYLIARGATVEATSAARLGLFDVLKQLIAARPELVHLRGGDGQTPLHQAATVEIAEFLLAKGAAIDARDVDHESTPAQYAVRERPDVARYLVSRGCWTDILMAAALGDRDLVTRHLDADPASVRKSVSDEYFPKQNLHAGGTIYIWTLGPNKTAHLVARERGYDELFRLLLDRSPNDLQLAVACEVGDESLIANVARRDPDVVRTLPAETRRKLVAAAHGNETRAALLMLSTGWPADIRTGNGQTALHFAAFHGNLEMVRALLEHRAPVDVKEAHFGGTPLTWALHGSRHSWHCQTGRYPEVVDTLLNAGAAVPPDWDERDLSEPIRAVLSRRGV
jgi:ankyrin repeat protein